MKRAGLKCVLGALMIFLLCGKIGQDVSATNEPDAVSSAQSGALRQRAYVWQRVWSEQLQRDIREHASDFAVLDVLATEIDFRASPPKVSSTAAKWSLLKETGVSVGIVVRIGPRTRPWKTSPREVEVVTRICRQALASARTAGISPAELQVDFDAATSQVGDYRILISALRPAIGGVPLTITALPTWMGSPEFPELAASVDSYVLQLHSLNKPAAADVSVSLFDAEQSQKWVKRAAEIGRPFRLALPAYGYRVGFGRDGRFLGLQAEGIERAWAAGTMTKTVWAEPDQIAPFVAATQHQRPDGCGAICWFRFPCTDDDLSWRWATLASVMKGQTPRSRLILDPVESETGAVDLCVRNDGADRAKFHALRVNWTGASMIVADGIDGWRIEHRGENEIVLQRDDPAESELRPGESMQVGWFHLNRRPTEISVVSL